MSDETLTQLAESLATHLDGKPRATQVRMLSEAIASITEGMKVPIVLAIDEAILATLGPLYAGPGKLRDRVRALEDIARSATKVVAFDGDIMSAAFEARIADLTAALEPLGTAPPPKTG